MIKIKTTRNSRIEQGSILRDVEVIEYISEVGGFVEISKISYPLVVVLTQDCDLEQDSRFRKSNKDTQDKLLISVLVAPLYNAEHFRLGNHLSELNQKMQELDWKKSLGKFIKQNSLPRYHYLEFEDRVNLVPQVIDFKHFFTVNLQYLLKHRNKNFIGKISDLYREDISQRFALYLTRIGLPEISDK